MYDKNAPTVAIYNNNGGKLMKEITTSTTSGSKININVWANGGSKASPNEALNEYTL